MSTSFDRHLALFGGSFNPPHQGHLQAILGLKINPGVGRVIVVPSRGTPLKSVTTSFQDRLEMARLAFGDAAEVSDLEGRNHLTYTWELLEQSRSLSEYRAFVIGTDQFLSLRSWNRFPDVLSLSDWIVLLRKPQGMDSIAELLRDFQGENVLQSTPDLREWRVVGSNRVVRFVDTDAPEISSTTLRENFALGKKKENTAWISPRVIEFIERKHLYGT
jgi:nicotinate-nucleotide adenylyltransferase